MLHALFILRVNELDNEPSLHILYKIIYIIFNNMESNDMIAYHWQTMEKGINDLKKQNKMASINASCTGNILLLRLKVLAVLKSLETSYFIYNTSIQIMSFWQMFPLYM